MIEEVAAGRPIDGVVGARAFEQVQATFDPAAATLTMVRGDKRCAKELEVRRKGTGVPFWIHDEHVIFVRALVNGSPGLYLFNSAMRGAGVAATVSAFARAGVGSPVMHDDVPGAFVDVDAVQIGDEALGATVGAWGWAEQDAPDQFRVDGMLGLEALGGRTWTLDFPQQKLYVHPGTAKAAAPAAKPAQPAAKPAQPAAGGK